jgi:hypothetical protein
MVLGAITFLGALIIEIIDRLTESPAMRSRVNEGSDRFFNERGTIVEAAARKARQANLHSW